LQLEILKDICKAFIDLNRIKPGAGATYNYTDGYITIEKKLWSNGVMKAEFNFNFAHKENPEKPIY
jgi:hypothetical protein